MLIVVSLLFILILQATNSGLAYFESNKFRRYPRAKFKRATNGFLVVCFCNVARCESLRYCLYLFCKQQIRDLHISRATNSDDIPGPNLSEQQDRKSYVKGKRLDVDSRFAIVYTYFASNKFGTCIFREQQIQTISQSQI